MMSNREIFKTIIFLFICTILNTSAFSQFIMTDAGTFLETKEIRSNQSKDISTINLPFVDDFSSSNVLNSDLWVNNGAFVNDGFAFHPLSIGIVTLDALDSEGKIYANANTTGFACDTLTSCFIRLDSNTATSEIYDVSDSIYFYFFYQPGGATGNPWDRTGSVPGKKDSLIVQFYKYNQDNWESVYRIEGKYLDSLYKQDSVFWGFANIALTDTAYFTSGFRFRFINYASLNDIPQSAYLANCDNWNIDYVYLNKDRTYNNKSLMDITFAQRTKSLLKDCQAVPYRQYQPSQMKDSISVSIANLNNTVLNSVYTYYIYNKNGNQVFSYNGGYENIESYWTNNEYQTARNHSSPVLN